MNQPERDFLAHFQAAVPDGMGLGAGYVVSPYDFLGTEAQITILPYGIIEESNTNRYSAYPLQIAVYVPYTGDAGRILAKDTAASYARLIRDAYKSYDDRTSAATGLTFGDWHADFICPSLMGVVDDISISGGGMVKAVVNLRLRNLHPA